MTTTHIALKRPKISTLFTDDDTHEKDIKRTIERCTIVEDVLNKYLETINNRDMKHLILHLTIVLFFLLSYVLYFYFNSINKIHFYF